MKAIILPIPGSEAELRVTVPADHVAKSHALFEDFCNATIHNVEAAASALPPIILALFIEYTYPRDVSLASSLLTEFQNQFLHGRDIHVAVSELQLDIILTQTVLRAYYSAWELLQHQTSAKPSALFASPKTRLLAIFGGQGGMDDYINETRFIYMTYHPLVAEFVASMAGFLGREAAAPLFRHLYTEGFDVLRWITQPDSVPSAEYMTSVPVSIPMVGLTQLMHIVVSYKTLGVSPGEFAGCFKAAAGHSQGITVAAALSMAKDEPSFYETAKKALGILLLTGAFPQLDYPRTQQAMASSSADDMQLQSVSPMVTVIKLTRTQLETAIAKYNQTWESDADKVYLSLSNCALMHVVSGTVKSLEPFVKSLESEFDHGGVDQTRVPFSQRKPGIAVKFLSISGPYHCKLLEHAVEGACQYAEERGWLMSSADMQLPVRAGDDGHDIRSEKNISAYLLKSSCVLPVDWIQATRLPGVTHIVDFGPGGVNGFGALTFRNHEGHGVPVICIGAYDTQRTPLGTKTDLYKTDMQQVKSAPNWQREFGPRLVRTSSDGRIHIDTRMTRLLGKPPVMVAGMTPSTVSEVFVSAVMRAGYHIELSGGGHFSEPMLRDKVDRILKLTDSGHSVTINSIYVNPFLWNIQYPAMQAMRREGVPLDGLCIGAGVPSFEVANEIIHTLRAVGFRHIGLKPSSVSTIRLAIKIAQANPDFPVMLQWTGGRGGGHHSFEDFHQPILETYGAIRARKNIVLVAGSGFGGVDDTLPYITGEWSKRFGYAPMPFDGVLLGSRVMVVKEGQAADAVKEAIVAAPGVTDAEWEQTYRGPAGGIVTVLSEMGEPIHKIATRGVMFWKEMDDTIFSQPRDRRLPLLLAKKNYIIERLNKDFQKPWFGKKADGRAVDLEEMTYAEVANRLLEVLYVSHQSRWIDVTMRNLVGDYLRQLEQRFISCTGPSFLQSFDQLDDPFDFVKLFLNQYPDSFQQLLSTEDIQQFISLCMRPGQKPVPFIPLMDKDFHIWFKKDSLWQAEDIDAVAGQDVGRVCILQGPVAVRYSTKANEPVKDILDNIYHGQIASLLDTDYGGDESRVPTVAYLGGMPNAPSLPSHVQVAETKSQRTFVLSRNELELPSVESWLAALAGTELNWLHALLMTPTIVQHYTYTDSIVRRVMRPRIGQMVNITLRDKMPQKVEVIDASGDLALDFCIDSDDIIHFRMYSRPRATVCTLELMLRFVPNTPFAPIHEVMAGRNQRIKRFYSQVWFEDNRDGDSCIGISDPAAIFSTEAAEISPDTVLDFCYAIGNKSKYYIDPLCDQKMVPLDYAIRAFWPTLCKCLVSQTSDGDLLNLVHLSNGFRVLSGANRLKPGQTVSSTAKITKVMDTPSGRRVQVRGAINQESVPIIEITTSFLFRGCTPNYASNFHDIDEQPISLHLASKTDVALLNSKEWFVQASGGKDTIRPGSVLEFHLKSRYRFKMHKVFASVHTFGPVYIHASSSSSSVPAHVGEVDYEAGESYGNPVIEFLKRYGRPKDGVRQLESDIPLVPGSRIQLATVTAPASNHQYSYASTDHNPIHTSPYFADYANLPGTITHGMWTSANARRCVEIFAAHGHPQRVRAFDAKFTDMVLPGDRLETKLYHVGMKDGCMLVRAETVNQHGTTVLTAVAEVEQPPTVFAFPGQGAHEQGMGMELYARSEPARRIWDSANEFMRTTYGIPLIDIVRNNPKTYTVHFVGERGLRIRENYRAMVYEYSSHDGAGSLNRPLFPEITENTDSFTFSYPNGLLYATQFTQPAILLCEIAEFVHLEASGIVPKHAAYAGHSLGEYAGLTAIANIMTPESAADLGFCRGLTMQQSVRRNSNGQSIYAMMAVSPARVGKWFTADNLETVVNAVQLYGQYDGLLEIVNYNVRGEQYVVSGELILLEALNRILEAIIKLGRLPGSLVELTRASVQSALHIRERTGYIPPRRTSATIPIHGIDVPFHSTILGAGVQSFRKVLQTKISPDSIIPDRLCGRYIPNLTARPFDTTKEYIENVYALTKSPFVLELIQNYSSSNLQADPILVQQVTYTLLIEILAYQFSSPVRWIETQDVMLTEIEVNRFIEVGPGSVLGSMLKRSLFRTPRSSNADSDAIRERTEILCTSSDISKIMFQDRPVAEAPLAAVETAAPIQNSKPMPQKPVQPAVAASIPAVSAGGGGSSAAEEIPDAPVQPLETIRALVAYKLKCGLGAISADRAIKDFVGGKSTVQNEIIGDLQKEFKDDFPEKPEEIPLNELAQNLSPTADSLGKHSSALLARMISSKMPGGYGRAAISKHLSSTFGLGPMRQCGLLLVALTLEPAARLDSESSAKKWLATVAHEYAALANVTYKAAASSSSSQGPGGGAVAVINSAEFEASQLAQKQMAIQQMRVLARYLGITVDAAINGSASGEEQENADSEGWLQEHGEFYADNFKPKFSAPMARHFDSSWNWARQDLLELYYQLVLGKITKIDLSMASNCLHLVNRLTPSVMDSLKFIVGHSSQHLTQGHRLAHKYGLGLLERCSECVGGSPVYQFTAKLLAPCLQMDHTGSVVYKEVERPGEQSIVDYVSTVTDRNSSQIAATLKASHAALDKMIEQLDLSHMFAPAQQKLDMPKVKLPPMVHLRSKVRDPTVWEYDPALSELYTNALNDICENGLTFANKTALLTGCGRGSIGVEVLKGLLEGGASVVVTTSSYSHKTMRYFQGIYQSHGSRGSQLVVVPFNQGSRQDIESLVSYIFGDASKGRCLGWDLDYVLPFAAIPEMGCEITDLGSQSELAHRAMLTNVFRLLGEIKQHKSRLGYDMHPTLAVLPLSPNHGAFGGDGLYGESKIGLETLFGRWHSESWSSFITLSGAVIGWTRGTGLMGANNIIAECVERVGARTFSTEEMAFNILGLMHPRMYALAALSPVWADMAGNFQYYPSLIGSTATLRHALRDVDTIQRAVAVDSSLDYTSIAGSESERVYGLFVAQKRANHRFAFPEVKSYEQLDHLHYLQDMVNLDKVAVVTGYGEVGLFGNAELRWEMEAHGEFSLEGCIELAWIMGLIKHFNGKLQKTGKAYTGWIDANTEDPVRDIDVKSRYEKHILEHTGIRLIEPELLDGYDPNKKGIMCEVQLEYDMEPFEATVEEASQFRLRNGDNCCTWANDDGSWSVKLLKGATIMVPKALRFDRLVAAQVPTGWSAERYGIPKDIADQIDPITCYAIVATVEALVRSGITDPYEIYQYVHVSEIGSSSGTALGGLKSMKRVFAERLCDKDQQADVYQETFVTTPPAWINMLLLSASGPIKTTIGACASSVASIDVAIDTILSGKAKIMVAGGMDGFSEESSYEFAQMNATSNSVEEFARGRTPKEMSRPCTTTRSGFMEGEGAGIVIVMSASTALQIGAPIHGILAMTGTATDKEGRSVPAPGQGVLTSARERTGAAPSPLLDIRYRRRQLRRRQSMINEWRRQELDYMRQEVCELRQSLAGLACDERTFVSERTEFIDHEAIRQLRESTDLWGNFFWRQDPRIAPLRGSLAVWGLTVDDIGVASFHGTSTKANDKNESEIIDCQLRHLGRTPGNPVLAVCQKWLTGHPKGAAAAWMLNGAMQILRTGTVPGNRNADNIASELEKFNHVVYPSRSIQTDGVKAVLLKSFGFGQVGGEILVIHPDYLFATLGRSQLDTYKARVMGREQSAYRHWHNALTGSSTFVQIKTEPPYTAENEQKVYLDPLARTKFDPATRKYTF